MKKVKTQTVNRKGEKTKAPDGAMVIDREQFLRVLEMVGPGLSPREIIEQSSMFAFKDGMVFTFNEEIACRAPTGLPASFVGAVKAEPLRDLLRKLPERTLTLSVKDKQLVVSGKKRAAKLVMAETVMLPVDQVERPADTDWQDMPTDFTDAIGIVQECAGTDQTVFMETCVHIHPKWMEANDNFNLCRYSFKTGVKEPMLVRRDSVKYVPSLDIIQFAVTPSWLHFTGPSGLVFSCRRFVEHQYDDLTPYLDVKGVPATLPRSLGEAADVAQIFSGEDKENNQVKVQFRTGKLKLTGQGSAGSYTEVKNMRYKGPPLDFMISPKLLIELVKRHTECTVSPEHRLMVDGGKWRYVACLEKVAPPVETKESEDAGSEPESV